MSAYKKLEETYRRLHNLSHVAAIVGWDESVNMPVNSGDARANALAELGDVMHNIAIDPSLAIHYHKAGVEKLNKWQEANYREMKESWEKTRLIPNELLTNMTKANIASEQAWRKMRAENDWKNFKPYLDEVVKLQIEGATIISDKYGISKYDALIDDYEPGMTTKEIDLVFNNIKSFLPTLVNKIINKQQNDVITTPTGPFAIDKQRELGIKLATITGFDFTRGRLDVSHHPFCGGVPEDIRITTRYDLDNFMQSLLGVLHEAGHGKYEQGLPKKWIDQPVGTARSMGVHESQSLLQEMQVCRSKEFIESAIPHIKAILNVHGNAYELNNLHRYYTRVEKSLIRVDADEATYPLHIILRYEIERDLINGLISVNDIPDLWDIKMKTYLGLDTKGNFKDGCMQDVHWPSGMFGYFPSYTLGALMAAQFYNKAVKDHPIIPIQISKGNWKPLNKWLEKNIWSQGSFHSVKGLVKHATGENLNTKYFKNHLTTRYLK